MAFLGLSVGLLVPWLTELRQPPNQAAEEAVADFAADIIKRAKERLKQNQLPPPPAPEKVFWPAVVSTGAIAAGLIGILLGVISWIRREDHRVSGSAVVVGAAAVAWQYLLLAAAVAIFLVLLYIVLANLG